MVADARTSLVIPPFRIVKYTNTQTLKGKSLTLIKSTPHPTLPIAILNYTNDAAWRNIWDDLTMAARVLVVEPLTGTVISRSFSKFFNYNESGAYKPTGEEIAAVVEEKLDGSIASLFWYQNQWIWTSKSQFDSEHVEMAKEILKEKYPGVTNTLDKDQSYIFEVIHPKNRMPIEYTFKDLVLLSTIRRDGAESPSDFDWSVYPFPRPKLNDVSLTNLEAIQKLNRANEEGFVVKFFHANSVHPDRVKIKFETYLDLLKSKTCKSPNDVLEIYLSRRSRIYTFDKVEVKTRMVEARESLLSGLRRVSDDLGGEKWIQQIAGVWAEIDEGFVEREAELRRMIDVLKMEGYEEHIGTKDAVIKGNFAKRIMQDGAGVMFKQVLFLWISGAPEEKQVQAFVRSVAVNKDLRSTDVFVEGRRWKPPEL